MVWMRNKKVIFWCVPVTCSEMSFWNETTYCMIDVTQNSLKNYHIDTLINKYFKVYWCKKYMHGWINILFKGVLESQGKMLILYSDIDKTKADRFSQKFMPTEFDYFLINWLKNILWIFKRTISLFLSTYNILIGIYKKFWNMFSSGCQLVITKVSELYCTAWSVHCRKTDWNILQIDPASSFFQWMWQIIITFIYLHTFCRL